MDFHLGFSVGTGGSLWVAESGWSRYSFLCLFIQKYVNSRPFRAERRSLDSKVLLTSSVSLFARIFRIFVASHVLPGLLLPAGI